MSTTASKASTGSRPHILIADDNRDLAENLGEILAAEGYETTIVEDGAQAVDLAIGAGQQFDLVLLDVKMPRKDGITACIEILAHHSGTRIVLMTAYASRADRALEAGALKVVRKPVEIDEFLELLARVAGRSA